MKKVVDYDVPHISSINDDQVYPVLWAIQIGKMGGPLSQLYRHHTALQMTVT